MAAADSDPLSRGLSVLDSLFDKMPIGIAVFDRNLTLYRCNPIWVEFISRCTPSAGSAIVPGKPIFEIVPGAEEALKPLLERALRGEVVDVKELRVDSGGIRSHWDVVFAPLFENGQVSGVIDVTADATERVLAYQTLERRVEERTREIERRRMVAEGLRDTLAVLNSDQPLEFVLDYIVGQAGLSLGTAGVSLYRLDHETQTLTIQAAVGIPKTVVDGLRVPVGHGTIGETVLTRRPATSPDTMIEYEPGSPEILSPEVSAAVNEMKLSLRSLLSVPLIIRNEIYGGLSFYYESPRHFTQEDTELAGIFADQAAMAIENARLRVESEEAAAVAERNRLARDLHDAVTQTLFSAGLVADVLPRLWARDPEEGMARLEEVRELTRGALAEMRTLLLELRPGALTETGLPDLLRHLAHAITGRARVPVRLTVEGQGTPTADVQIAFYRVAQEALSNMAKHSRADRAEVFLSLDQERVCLEVRDNGRGFNPALVPSGHLGLGIMRERALAVGARLEILSAPDNGTTVRMTLKDAVGGEVMG